jgi:hypothetical protein
MAEKTPETKKPTPFDHTGRPVFILLPFDAKDRRVPLEFVESMLPKLAEEPIVRTELKLGRMQANSVIYVVHPVVERVKEGEYFQNRDVPFVSEPIEMKHYVMGGVSHDDLPSVNVVALADAITKACKPQQKHRVYRAQLSAEKNPLDKSVKLLNS